MSVRVYDDDRIPHVKEWEKYSEDPVMHEVHGRNAHKKSSLYRRLLHLL